MAPSPTAEATRLTESARTSPATNTPGTLAVDQQVRAGEHEAPLVALEHPGEPVGARTAADEHEHVAGLDPLLGAGGEVAQAQLLQVLVAVNLVDHRAEAHRE